jgi:hypothetical protein
MSEYMFGVSYTKPTRKEAKRRDRICREEGGYGLVEVNVRPNEAIGINNGRYQSWFTGPNYGAPFDEDLKRRVMERIEAEG